MTVLAKASIGNLLAAKAETERVILEQIYLNLQKQVCTRFEALMVLNIKIVSSKMWHHIVWYMIISVSEEYNASIFSIFILSCRWR
jgi:hypothetical protein